MAGALSVATVTVRAHVESGPGGTVNHAFAIHRPRLAASIGLGRSRTILVRLGCPGGTSIPVVAARGLSVAAHRLTMGVFHAFCKCVCGEHYTRQYH